MKWNIECNYTNPHPPKPGHYSCPVCSPQEGRGEGQREKRKRGKVREGREDKQMADGRVRTGD
jgi:hypothetical protein